MSGENRHLCLIQLLQIGAIKEAKTEPPGVCSPLGLSIEKPHRGCSLHFAPQLQALELKSTHLLHQNADRLLEDGGARLRRPFVNAEGLAGVAHDEVIEVIPFPKERIHSCYLRRPRPTG